MATLLVMALLVGQWQQHVDSTRVIIEGKRNPELVPAYAAWLSAFESIDGAANLGVPTVLINVLTKQEQGLLLTEAHRIVTGRGECRDQLLAARAPLAKLEATGPSGEAWTALAKKIDLKMWEIELKCRWDTLHARDHLLRVFSPEGGLALAGFVEEQKKGLTFYTTKSGLERFRQPQ